MNPQPSKNTIILVQIFQSLSLYFFRLWIVYENGKLIILFDFSGYWGLEVYCHGSGSSFSLAFHCCLLIGHSWHHFEGTILVWYEGTHWCQAHRDSKVLKKKHRKCTSMMSICQHEKIKNWEESSFNTIWLHVFD